MNTNGQKPVDVLAVMDECTDQLEALHFQKACDRRRTALARVGGA